MRRGEEFVRSRDRKAIVATAPNEQGRIGDLGRSLSSLPPRPRRSTYNVNRHPIMILSQFGYGVDIAIRYRHSTLSPWGAGRPIGSISNPGLPLGPILGAGGGHGLAQKHIYDPAVRFGPPSLTSNDPDGASMGLGRGCGIASRSRFAEPLQRVAAP